MSNGPPPLSAAPKPPFARTAAQFCAWSPLIAIGMNVLFSGMARQGGPGSQVFAYIGSLMMLLGVALGIFALCSIPRHGRKGLLFPSIVGITINVALFALAFVAVSKLSEKARAINAKGNPEQRQPGR